MTELEVLQRAKMYIDKLANGVNPLTDLPAEEGDIVNNVRISRCFFYISDVLRKVIDNGGEVCRRSRKEKKPPFLISQEQLEAYIPTSTPIPVSDFAARISELVSVEGEQTPKLCYKVITSWLIEAGLLEEKVTDSGKKIKRPTEQGREIGILTESRNGQFGPYTVVLYSSAAQQFIIDNFSAVLELSEKGA